MASGLLTPARRDERGAVAVVFAICAVLLFVMAGLVVDLGSARDARRQSQNSADASSLAAANKLYPLSGQCTLDTPTVPPCFLDATKAAKDYAASNFGTKPADWTTCTDSGAYWKPPSGVACVTFTDNTLATTQPAQPTKVRVAMPIRKVVTGLGVLVGIKDVPVGSMARATLNPGQARSCGLCILGNGISPLGNGDVTVTGGSVFSNGTIDSGPNGHMTATPSPNSITLVGTCPGNCSPTATTGAAPITDPYAGTVALPPAGMAALGVKSNPCTDGPGKYAAFQVPNSSCTLQPGLYVLTGAWDMKNNTLLMGTGVTLYGTCGTAATPAVCTTGQAGGYLDTKNGDTQLVAPTSGPLTPFAIIYDRQNVSALNIQGNGNSFVTGVIYAPKAELQFPGNSCVSVTNGPVIVGSLYGNGNQGCVNLTSVNGANIPEPPQTSSLDQ